MALALDGTAQSGTSTASATTALGTGLNYATAADILVVFAIAEWKTSPAGSVSGITSTSGLTWARRASLTYTQGTTNTRTEMWWAYNPAANAADVVTVTWTNAGTIDDTAILAFAVKGFTGTAYQTAPWDGNVSLPNALGSSTTGLATSGAISTTSASGMVLTCGGTTAGPANTGIPAGYTQAGTVSNTGGTNNASMTVGYNVISSALSGTTVTWSSSSTNGWMLITDVLATAGSGAADTLFPQSWG